MRQKAAGLGLAVHLGYVQGLHFVTGGISVDVACGAKEFAHAISDLLAGPSVDASWSRCRWVTVGFLSGSVPTCSCCILHEVALWWLTAWDSVYHIMTSCKAH